jgi:hypothetical protein
VHVFIQALADAEDLSLIGLTANEELIIRNHTRKETWAVPVSDIQANPAADILAVLRRERKPNILETYSRIVGYWSRLSNWNRSKLAEAADRRRGNYALPERLP